MFFIQNGDAHTGPLFKNSKIVKFNDKVALENWILISKSLHKEQTQKSFVTGSLCPLNFAYKIPDGQIIVL